MDGFLIDTHTHLDDDAFQDDRDEVIAASNHNGVTRWINVGHSPERWTTTIDLANCTEGMYYMLGLHPSHADEWSRESESQLEALLRSRRPVAIGEIGLDLHWRQDNLQVQREVLERQLSMAIYVGLPVVIHMRDADAEMLSVLENTSTLPHLHFHSFDGDERLRTWALAHGCTIGVGGLMTRKGSDALRGWIAGIPRDRVVLETDSPYLKPQGIRGQRNQPAYLTRVAGALAQLWNLPLQEVGRISTANALRIFDLDGKGK